MQHQDIPGSQPDENDADMAGNISIIAEAVDTLYAASNMVTWEMVRSGTSEDPTLQRLVQAIQDGFPSIQQLPEDAPSTGMHLNSAQ